MPILKGGVLNMSEFLGVHKIPSGTEDAMSEDEIRDGFKKYKEAAAKLGLKASHVHISMEKGFAYCLTEADSADQVRTAHENIAPLEDVIEVITVD